VTYLRRHRGSITGLDYWFAALDRFLTYMLVDWNLKDEQGAALPIALERIAELPRQQRFDMAQSIVRVARPWWRRWPKRR
jgi:hypothetical protein